jgi:hypothetical protein
LYDVADYAFGYPPYELHRIAVQMHHHAVMLAVESIQAAAAVR